MARKLSTKQFALISLGSALLIALALLLIFVGTYVIGQMPSIHGRPHTQQEAFSPVDNDRPGAFPGRVSELPKPEPVSTATPSKAAPTASAPVTNKRAQPTKPTRQKGIISSLLDSLNLQ